MKPIDQIIQEVTLDLFHHVGVSCSVDVVRVEDDNHLNSFEVSVTSDQNLSAYSGRNGVNIGSFEHLVRILLVRQNEFKDGVPYISLDINNIKKERHDQVKLLARTVASRVIENKRPEVMAPMDSFERRLVHNELATVVNIETESIGIDPNRRIVVKPVLL